MDERIRFIEIFRMPLVRAAELITRNNEKLWLSGKILRLIRRNLYPAIKNLIGHAKKKY